MKKGITIIILLCVFISCKREYDKSKFGPEVIIVPENFTVNGFTINPSNAVNLATQDVYFGCAMSQRAEFKIVISGMLSGAVKTVSGTGEFIDLSNSLWTGDSDNLNIFRNGEDCLVELSFHGATKKYYDTITVTAPNVYPNTFLINDFEGITFDKNGPNMATYGNYFDAGDFAQSVIRTNNTLATPQGTQSVEFDAKDVNNSFYIGGMYFFPLVAPYVFNATSPDSLYLNAYVYSYGDNSTSLIFTYTEDDNGDNVGDVINDDSWVKEVPVEGKGWSLVSIRFKDFTDEKATVGNGIRNTNKIVGFNLNIKGKTAGAKVHTNVDYITVTSGRPFEP